MMRNYDISVSDSNRPKKSLLILVLAIVLLVGFVAVFLYFSGFFYHRNAVSTLQIQSPNIAQNGKKGKFVASTLRAQLIDSLQTKTKANPYVVTWYVVPGALQSEPALQSEYLLAQDQIRLLDVYINSEYQTQAEVLINGIEKDFVSQSGYLVSVKKFAEVASLADYKPDFGTDSVYDQIITEADDSLTVTVQYLNALLKYYAKWGSASQWTLIEKYADLLYTENGESGLFREDLTVVVPTPPSIAGTGLDAPAGDPAQESSLKVLSLAALDLDVFRMLSGIDSKYQPLYDQSLAILKGALISQDVPMYAVGYTQSSKDYIYYLGDDSNVNLIPTLWITLYLSEVGQPPEDTIRWIKEQLYNNQRLFQSYDISSGIAATDVESYEAYGILLQIARVIDDADLYNETIACLQAHLATSDTSPIRGMIFRQPSTRRTAVYAQENLEALLGI